MKAVIRREYGSPERLSFEELPTPELGENDVLIDAHASSVNPYDWHMLRGEPYLLRMSEGLRRPKRVGLGIDVAGTVTAVGEKVTRFKPGDDVFGFGRGCFAECVAASEARLARKPDAMSFEAGATLACAGITALQALRKGGVKAGKTVLVNGAAGGVGTFVVQIAKSLGANVTGVCSTGNAEFVRSLGAEKVVDYTVDDFSRSGERYDVVLDLIGNRSLHALRRVLAPRGTLVVAGGAKGKWFRPLAMIFKALVVSPFVRQQLTVVMANVTPEDLTELSALIVAGTITPAIGRTYSLGEASEAVGYVEGGHAKGKVIIKI
jgi:NADPH:quinone reductase-like Zn-dependent oxidoreductase